MQLRKNRLTVQKGFVVVINDRQFLVESLQNSITLFDIKNDYQFLIKTKYMLRGTWYSEQKYCLVTVYVFIKKKKKKKKMLLRFY